MSTHNNRAKALAAYQQNRSVANRNHLIMENVGLLQTILLERYGLKAGEKTSYKTGATFWGSDPIFQDAFQEGIGGIIKAAETFDASKGSWSHHAYIWIVAYVGQMVRKNRSHEKCTGQQRSSKRPKENRRVIKTTSFSNSKQQNTDEFDLVASAEPNPEQAVIHKQLAAAAQETIGQMIFNERERALLERHIAGDDGLTEMAAELGVSKQRMGQIKQRILKQIWRQGSAP